MDLVLTLLAILVGTAAIFGIGHWSAIQANRDGKYSELRKQFWYQPTAFIAVWLLAWLFSLVTRDGRHISLIGNLTAATDAFEWLGFAKHTSWSEVGPTFVVIPFVVTVVVVYFQLIHKKHANLGQLPLAVLAAIPLSVANSLTEEILFRYIPVRGLSGQLAPIAVALLCAIAFGAPHYFGKPGKIPGVLMAGFLGYVMAWSVLDTGSLEWAWIIHFVQDVPIIAMLLML